MSGSVSIRNANPQEDSILVDLYGRHWVAMGVDHGEAAFDWRQQALEFIRQARLTDKFAGFLAFDRSGPVGGACCQVAQRRYPRFLAEGGKRQGYIWGVYVSEKARRSGIGARLIACCEEHLRMEGCDTAVLHAGTLSRPLYLRSGYVPTDEFTKRLSP